MGVFLEKIDAGKYFRVPNKKHLNEKTGILPTEFACSYLGTVHPPKKLKVQAFSW